MTPDVYYTATCAPRKEGFAIVVALSLMAFVLVLVLAMTTLVSVESGASKNAMDRLAAKQNALLAMYVAVGELQKAAGPDQRVTARADVLDANPDTLQDEGVQNPHYLGVYKAIDTRQPNQSRELLRAWATDAGVDGRIDWLVSARTDLSAANADPATTNALALNGGEARDIIELAKFEAQTGGDSIVQAGLLDIFSGSNASVGRYAWWVSDENAKFRVNQAKPDEVLDGQAFEPRWSLMAPHRANPAVIPDLNTFDITDPIQTGKLERLFSPDSFQLIDPSWGVWTQANEDDYTFYSQSIPVDVTQGRLKQDLTTYLETTQSGLADADYIVRGTATDTDYLGQLNLAGFQVNPVDAQFPQFGLLKSWYENGTEIFGLDQGTPQPPVAHSPDSHGLHPVIMRSAIYFGVSYEVQADGNLLPVYLVYPKFVLWNPHNVPIAPARYVVQVRAFTTINTQISADLSDDGVNNPRSYAAINITPGGEPFGYQGNLPAQPANNTFAHLNLANSAAAVALERDPDDDYPYFTFVIDDQGFAPGQTLYFTGSDKHPDADYVDETIDNIPSDFSDHNLLVNEDEGPLGFFYLRAGAPIIPLPNDVGDPVPSTLDTDTLQTTIYFRDTLTRAPEGSREPSLSSKLYHYTDSDEAVLLQELDFKGADLASTVIDWEHINSEGKSQNTADPLTSVASYRSLNYYKNTNTFEAEAHRGHGYFITVMGSSGSGNRPRLLARHNLAVSEVTADDPLLPAGEIGRIYSDTFPTPNWFSGPPFPSEIPKDISYPGVLADGYDRLGGFGLFENSVNFSQGTVYPVYDSVRGETGLLSLGFLTNVNFSQFYWQPTYAFGLSEAHTHVSRNAVQSTEGGVQYTDLSYLINESMWDRFFLSTIPQTGAFDPTDNVILPNTQHRIVAKEDGTLPSVADLRSSSTAFEQAAASIVVEGGFNVNSTSVEAWTLLLAAMRGESVLTADGNRSNLSSNAPLSSKVYPLLSELAAVDPSQPETWSALRSLSDAEIDALARAIVEEVKRRGPFLSLSDFVNRRLVDDAGDAEGDFLGLKGALQAAIDKVSTSGQGLLNEAFYQSPLNGLPTGAPNGMPNNSQHPEHESGMPEGIAGSRMFGVPSFLTQGDILSALGPALTVRGDTFTVRAYGESNDPLTGKVVSKVWCEAVVQRIAEPVDANDSIVQPTGAFGRSFKILSIRWLDGDEII